MTDENWEECTGNNGIWLPKKAGECLQGEVQSVRNGLYGLQLDIMQEDGTVLTTPSHKVLQARLKEFKVGDKIRIEFKGQELPKIKGQLGAMIYKVYKYVIKEEKVE